MAKLTLNSTEWNSIEMNWIHRIKVKTQIEKLKFC